MSNSTAVEEDKNETDIRSIREINGEIEDGPCDVLVFNEDVYYPLINIDPKSIIKPSIINIKPNDVFIETEKSTWKKAYVKWRTENFCSSLEFLANLSLDNQESFGKSFVRNLAFYILYIWRKILLIYVYFYPFALLSQDELCEKFCKFNNFEGIIRHVVWHPKKHKVALALSNDSVYIYSSNLITPLLKHPLQKKITDIKWHPVKENELTIACANCILIWNIDSKERRVRLPNDCAKILKGNFYYPITSIDYNKKGNYLAVCSPSSSRILFFNLITDNITDKEIGFKKNNFFTSDSMTKINSTFNILNNQKELEQINLNKTNLNVMDTNSSMAHVSQNDLKMDSISDIENKEIRIFGTTISFFVFSPDSSRICVGSTEFGIRVYETETFSWRNWGKDLKSMAKCACWNQSSGKILLFTTCEQSKVYAIIFYDKAETNYVGGTSSFIPVLDVKETILESGVRVGGLVQDIVWDQNSERLVVSFVNNPKYLAIYRTKIKPSLEITSIGFIHGLKDEIPLCYSFHNAFKNGSLLTVCWNSGYVSHIPLQYDNNEKKKEDKSQFNATNVRSLTSFCMSQIMSDDNTSFISPDTSNLNITKKYLTKDSVISPRKPLLFSSFSENFDKNSSIQN